MRRHDLAVALALAGAMAAAPALAQTAAGAADPGAAAPQAASPAGEAAAPATTVTANLSWYALPDESDFAVAVGAVNRGPWRVEARINYEAKDAGSLFFGRRWSGHFGADEAGSFELTPMIGAVFGSVHGVVPALLASVGWRAWDVYVEAEYVRDHDAPQDASYFYAWSELGFKPTDALRIGLVTQRTRLVTSDRSLQRGLFAQFVARGATLSAYAFNPEAGSRYWVVSVAAQF